MYAIIKSGSRQYQVQPESVIAVNRLKLEQGAAFETDQVLLLDQDGGDVQIGTPFVSGAIVKGRVLSHPRDRKVLVFKFKRRKNYKRTRGHRQELTQVRIESIELGGKVIAEAKPQEKPAKPARPPKAEAETEAAEAAAKPAAKTPAKKAAKPAAKTPAKKAAKPAAKAPAKKAAKSTGKAPAKKAAKSTGKAPAKKAAGKTAAKRSGKDKK